MINKNFDVYRKKTWSYFNIFNIYYLNYILALLLAHRNEGKRLQLNPLRLASIGMKSKTDPLTHTLAGGLCENHWPFNLFFKKNLSLYRLHIFSIRSSIWFLNLWNKNFSKTISGLKIFFLESRFFIEFQIWKTRKINSRNPWKLKNVFGEIKK